MKKSPFIGARDWNPRLTDVSRAGNQHIHLILFPTISCLLLISNIFRDFLLLASFHVFLHKLFSKGYALL